MIKTKRVLIAILSLVLTLTCTTLILSACQTDEFTVTVNNDSSKGTVEMSVPQSGGKLYAKGESVTVKVTPNQAYEVSSFTVTGYPDAALDNDNKYTFTVVENTVVTVEYQAKEGDDYYTVTVVSDSGATVTLSPASADGKYLVGTDVTVTLQLKEGYQLKSAYVANALVTFDNNNQYTFKVLSNTQVEVSTYYAIPDSVLQSLRGNVLFHGEVTESDTDGYVLDHYDFGMLYDVDKNLVRMWEDNDDDDYDSDYIFGSDAQGNLAFPTHSNNGVFTWVTAANSAGNAIPFSYYVNPFEYLTAQDFIYVSEGIWTLSATNIDNVMTALTGYDDYNVKTFEIVVENGVVTCLRFETYAVSYYGSTLYVTKGEIEVTEHGEYAIDPEIIIPNYDAQPELQAALEAAAKVTAYKAEHRYSDDPSLGYDVYRVGNVVWLDDGTDESFGYVVRPDGTVWAFGYEKGAMVLLSSEAVGDSIDEAVATFDLLGVSPSMFYKDASGRYVLHNCDLNGYYGAALVAYSAMSFATGGMELEEFYYAYNIAITVSDGKISKIELDYGDYVLTLSFSEFGTAELPGGVVIDDSVVNGTFPIEFLGTWLDDDNDMRIDITLDGATFNGVAATSISKTAQNSYTMTVEGATHTLTMTGDNALYLDGTIELRYRNCGWEDMIGTYSGTSQYETGSDSVEITITETSLTILLNNMYRFNLTAEQFSFFEEDGVPVLSFRYNDPDYGTCTVYVLLLAKKAAVCFMAYNDYDEGYYVNAYVEGYDFKDWSKFIGDYTSGDYTLKIEKEQITLDYNGERLVFNANQVTYEAVEYASPMFTMVRGTTEYTLQQYGSTSGKLALLIRDVSQDSPTRVAVFVRDGYNPSNWDIFEGLFIGMDDDGVEYRVAVTSDGATLYINGVPQSVTINDFDKYLYYGLYDSFWLYRFDFTSNGVQYELRQYVPGDINLLRLSVQGADLALCLLGRDQYNEITDWSNFVGTYSGEGYTVTVTAEGLTVTFGGVGGEVKDLVFYSNFDYATNSIFYQFSFVWNDHNCTFEPLDGGDAGILAQDGEASLLLINSNYVLNTNYSAWAGYYAAHDLSVIVKITKDTVSIAFDNGTLTEVTVIYFGEQGGMMVELNGKLYNLFYQPKVEWNDVNCISVADHGKLVGDVAYETYEPDPEADWSAYIGTWRGSTSDDMQYTVTISQSGITVKVGSLPAFTAVGVVFYYNSSWGWWQFSFMIGDQVWELVVNSETELWMSTGSATGYLHRV